MSRPSKPQPNSPNHQNANRRDGGRHDDRRGPPRNEGRRGPPRPDERGGPRDGGGGSPAAFGRTAGRDQHAVEFEYVVMTPRGSAAAEVRSSWLPLKWVSIETPRLLTPGVFIRRGGGLSRVSPDLRLDPVSAFVVWDDPDLEIPGGGRPVKPGCNVGILVPGPKDGPPFVPVHVVLRPQPVDFETGLLAPALDHIACQRLRLGLDLDRGEVVITSTELLTGDADAPLLATMRWLAENPADTSPGADLARRMLIESGHGLQRLGVLLAHRDVAERTRAIEDILPRLAPEAAPLLSALWQLFQPAELDGRTQRERFLSLVEAVSAELGRDSQLQTPRGVALVLTWVFGLFGFRPDRDNAQPARALFAAVSAARSVSRHTEALTHPDASLPALPLERATSSQLLREALSVRDGDPSPLETAIRAMAIAEWGIEIARPRLDTLRPFATLLGGLVGFPIASRTLVGRYAGVLTGWSLRGAELTGNRLDPAALHASLITELPDPTVSRAIGRVLGRVGAQNPLVAKAIAANGHPVAVALAEHAALEVNELAERLRDAVVDRRYTPRRLHTGIALIEQIAARLEGGATLPGGWLPTPEPPPQTSPRGQFMYWRAFCRGNTGALGDEQATWAPTLVAMLPGLPDRYALEATALLRSLARQRADVRDMLQQHTASFVSELKRAVETPGQFDAERVNNLLAILSDTAPDAFLAMVDLVLRRDDWLRFETARMLDSARRSAALADLVASDVFARLHRLAADATGHEAAALRGEWLRTALEKARRRNDIRWLTDGRTMQAFLQSPRFVDWFATRASDAAARADDALVELLEVAARAVADSDLDRLTHTFRRATRWPDSEQARAFVDAGRPIAAAKIALRTGATVEIAPLIEALSDGGADELATAAALLATTTRRGLELPEAARERLDEALARYNPNRYVLEPLGRVLDAARAIGVNPARPGWARQLDRAVVWAGETGHPALVRFAAYAADRLVADAVSGAEPTVVALETAIANIEVPQSLQKALAGAERSAAAKKLARAIQLAGGGNATLGALAFRSAAGTLGDDAGAVAAALRKGGDRAKAPQADATEPAASSSLHPALRAVAAEAFRRWSDLQTAARGDELVDPTRLAAEIAGFAPRSWSVRDDLLAAIESMCAARNLDLRDEHRLLGSDALEFASATCDMEDFRLAAETFLALVRSGTGRPQLQVERSRLLATLPPWSDSSEPAADDAIAESADRDAPELPEDDGAPEPVEDAAGGAGEMDDSDEASSEPQEPSGEGTMSDEGGPEDAPSEDQAGGEGDDAVRTAEGTEVARRRRDKSPQAPNPARELAAELTQALRHGAGPELAARFGGVAQLAVLRAALARNNELRMEFAAERRKLVVSLWWRSGGR